MPEKHSIPRRKLMKRTTEAGLITGGVVSVGTATVSGEPRDNKTQSTKKPFIEFSLQFPSINNALRMSVCRNRPTYIKSKDEVYVTSRALDDLLNDSSEILIASHTGMWTDSFPIEDIANGLPVKAHSNGQGTVLAEGKSNANISIRRVESDENKIKVVTNSNKYTVKNNSKNQLEETHEVHYTTKSGNKSKKEAKLQLSVNYSNNIRIHSHENNLLIPSHSPGGKKFRKYIADEEKRTKIQTGNKGQDLIITKHDNINAISIKEASQEGN